MSGISPILKVVSWNVAVENTEHSRVIELLREIQKKNSAVLICLQEVNTSLLHKILELSPLDGKNGIQFGRESVRSGEEGAEELCYSVIMGFGNLKLGAITVMDFPDKKPLTLRTRATIWLLTRLGKWHGTSRQHKFSYVDATFDGTKLRVFSAHFRLTYPSDRLSEWDALKRRLIPDRSIVCGDFNTIEKFPTSLMNFALGGTLAEGFATSERSQMEMKFQRAGLINPLRGHCTHKRGEQLDHILLPEGPLVKVWNRAVYHDRRGSDHHPVWVELTMGPRMS